ncbi:MAG TPA: magnesium/cobalt transporter CorA [Alphaproteobacteria bacterium]|nr:magnesium/cobalt transporter CorA [Alphaproteobacteria bacterium]
MGQVIASVVYEGGKRVADFDLARDAVPAPQPGRVIWIGLFEPSERVLQRVQALFGLHDLAIEDAHRAHQRPKLEVYGESVFMVLRTAQLIEGVIRFGETHVFAGKGYVVTIRHGPSHSYSEVRSRAETSPQLLNHGEDFIAYAVMDFVVDSYFPILDHIEAAVSAIEDHIFAHAPVGDTIERIYRLRRDLLAVQSAVSPLIEVCGRLLRFDLPVFDKEVRPYFRDVHDHVLRIHERIDRLRELLSFAFDASMQLAASRQNEVTKKLAAWAAILAIPTAVAGIYGMNFENMPELRTQYGYFAVLAVIGAACTVLWMRFRRQGWL